MTEYDSSSEIIDKDIFIYCHFLSHTTLEIIPGLSRIMSGYHKYVVILETGHTVLFMLLKNVLIHRDRRFVVRQSLYMLAIKLKAGSYNFCDKLNIPSPMTRKRTRINDLTTVFSAQM